MNPASRWFEVYLVLLASIAQLCSATTDPDAVLIKISPTCGSASGGTLVTLTGYGLGSDIACWFGNVQTAATEVSRREFTCVSPAGSAGGAALLVTVQGTFNLSSSDFPQFYYFDPPSFTAVSPSSGITNGHTALSVAATSLPTTSTAYCNAMCRFGSQLTVGATPSSSFDSLRCIAPAGFNFSQSVVSLQLSLNGVDFVSPGLTYTYTGPLEVGVVPDFYDQDMSGSDFFRDAKRGLDQATTEFGVPVHIQPVASESDADVDAAYDYLARNLSCKLILIIGWNGPKLDGLTRSATQWTSAGRHYSTVDISTDSVDLNIQGLLFREDQVAFAAGYLAGLVTRTGVVGVVGGIPVDAVKRFRNGYSLGVYAACPNCTVHGTYIYSFVDVEGGGAVAADYVQNRNADVIFGCGGMTGSGAILKAAALGSYVIGVDADEYMSTFVGGTVAGSNNVLTSTIKSTGVVAYQAIRNEYYGQWSKGNWVYGFAEGALTLAPCHATCSLWTDSVRSSVNTIISQFNSNLRSSGVDFTTGNVPGNSNSAGFTLITPMCAPSAGGTVLTLDGIGFFENGFIPKCFFGSALFTRATVSSARLMSCPSPVHAAGSVEFRVTVNGADDLYYFAESNFTFYDSPSGLSFSPTLSPLTGSTVVTIRGTGLGQPGVSCRPACRFGGVTSPQASYGANDTVLCSAPPWARINSVLLEVSLNSVDFVSFGTFSYYVSCPPGETYSSVSSSCEPCPPGSIANTGDRVCTPCALGHFSDSPGLAECQPCAVGQFANTTASAACYQCPPGSVSNNRGASNCTLCSPGHYQDRAGQQECITCKTGSFALNNGSTQCDSCPNGAECPSGAAVNALSGYWRVPWQAFTFEKCEKEAACPNSNGLETCRDGHKGVLCATCISDYALSSDRLCEKCGDPGLLKFLAFLVAVMVLVIIGYMVRSAYEAAIALACGERGLDEISVLIKIMVSYVQVTSMATDFNLKWPNLIISFFQGQKIASSPLNSLLSMDCLLQDSLSGTKAAYASVLAYILLPFIFLLFLALIFAGMAAFRRMRDPHGRETRLVKYEARSISMTATKPDGTEDSLREMDVPAFMKKPAANDADSKKPSLTFKSSLDSGTPDGVNGSGPNSARKGNVSQVGGDAAPMRFMETAALRAQVTLSDMFFLTSVVAFFLLYPAVTTSIFKIYRCITVSGKTLLYADLEIDCSSSAHQMWALGLGLPSILLIVISLPALALTYLWKHRHEIEEIRTSVRIGFLCRGYRKTFIWWEAIVLTRKISVITISVFFSGMVATQGLLCLGLLIIITILQAFCRPFSRYMDNMIEAMSSIVSMVTIYGGLYYYTGLSSTEESALTVTLVGLNLAFIVVWAVLFVKALLAALKRQHRYIAQKLLQAHNTVKGLTAGLRSSRASRSVTPAISPRSKQPITASQPPPALPSFAGESLHNARIAPETPLPPLQGLQPGHPTQPQSKLPRVPPSLSILKASATEASVFTAPALSVALPGQLGSAIMADGQLRGSIWSNAVSDEWSGQKEPKSGNVDDCPVQDA